jgi:hypothetical protein
LITLQEVASTHIGIPTTCSKPIVVTMINASFYPIGICIESFDYIPILPMLSCNQSPWSPSISEQLSSCSHLFKVIVIVGNITWQFCNCFYNLGMMTFGHFVWYTKVSLKWMKVLNLEIRSLHMTCQNKIYVLGIHNDIESYDREARQKHPQNTILHINFWKEYNGGHNSPRKLTKEKCSSYILQLLNQLIFEI